MSFVLFRPNNPLNGQPAWMKESGRDSFVAVLSRAEATKYPTREEAQTALDSTIAGSFTVAPYAETPAGQEKCKSCGGSGDSRSARGKCLTCAGTGYVNI